MGSYFHSVTLDKEKCVGCTNCIKRCPTEAIRVHEGKATIIAERCIDCGECIRVCPQHAKRAITDPLETIIKYKYPVAIPAPTLFGQFDGQYSVDQIIFALLQLGFAKVWEVARGAEIVTEATLKYIQQGNMPRPVISSACPAIVRLIRVRYPELTEHLLPLDAPMEVSARIVKQELLQQGYLEHEIGVFFITPCAAKYTSVHSPIGREKSAVDGGLAIADIYGPLLKKLHDLEQVPELRQAGGTGLKWAVSGGESSLLEPGSYIAADGLYNVARVLEDVVTGKLKDVSFIEALACPAGCVGGPLTVENPYMSKARIIALSSLAQPQGRPKPDYEDQELYWDRQVQPESVLKLDDDIAEAIKKMERLEELHKSLPGLDCGSCGAPTCRALAEDIVRGQADEIDCIFKLKEKVKEMAEDMVLLSSKLPPSISR